MSGLTSWSTAIEKQAPPKKDHDYILRKQASKLIQNPCFWLPMLFQLRNL